MYLHVDTCGGRNKNAIIIHYLLWRVMTKQHSEITLSFMIPGHTKFSPDWCFLLLKKYRRTKVGGLSNLCGVVNDSAAVKIAQLTGLEDGSVVVTTYNCLVYFSQFCTKVKSIKKLHHLRFAFFTWLHLREGESWSYRSEEEYLQGCELEAPGRQATPCPPTLRTLFTAAVVSIQEDQA